jgi:hypothetical protein
MTTFLRLGLALLLVAVFSATAVAAAKRYITVNNYSDATIDTGFLQPPSSGVLESYGTVNPTKSFTFTLNAVDTKIAVRSKACHGSTYVVLPTRERVTVNVTNGCKVSVQ